MSDEKLLKIASDIADMAARAVEDKKDNMKYADVEFKPSQVIERLYENLKLRVAVQRALRDHDASRDKGASAVYALVARHYDASTLGIGRDFPAWTWAEKEHDWNSKKDAALLFGIHVHGFGAWEDILNDDKLLLQQQRALKGERLKKRAENLLKRIPPPDSSGEPRIVSLAAALASPAQNTPNLGAQISAIVNGASVKGGRMQRAAERFAARQANGEPASSGDSRGVHEDSIRKSQMSAGQSTSSGLDHQSSTRKASISSIMNDDAEPEDGEVDTSPSQSLSKRDGSSVSSRRSTTTESASRSRDDTHRDTSNRSPSRKSTKHNKQESSSSSSSRQPDTRVTKRPRLSDDDLVEKWKPSKRLKEIRQVLKKMKIMADWSKNQRDEVVVEKVYKYVTTIGEFIDKTVLESEPRGDDAHEWDELCTALWTYAAEFTPFAPVIFERLYDDICADGDRLRDEARTSRREPEAAR
ncbi:hypothetical protein PINS_up000222 [Pythium insidiosum]|nr:hypothetical protein PINS_up000222 [Pythium insidiosum]